MRILLADDHTLVRENLSDFLQELDNNVTVIEADTFDGAAEIADRERSLDLIILDLMMPGMDGLNGLRQMIERHPDVPVVILSGSIRREDIHGAMDVGAKGYIPKTIRGKAMLNALRLILSGDTYIPQSALAAAVTPAQEPIGDPSGENAGALSFLDLTPREKEVLHLLVKGHPNKTIAKELGVKEVTVKVHLQHVFSKLGVSNRTQAVAKALGADWRT